MTVRTLGGALLAKLVPVVDASANCGRCERTPSTRCCSKNQRRIYYVDYCGNVCYTRCEYAPNYC
jgi:hypothetical protein